VFESELLRVSFTKDMWGRLLVPTGAIESDALSNNSNNDSSGVTLEERQAYGVQYNFCLNDEVGANKAAVDAPEWLVPQVFICISIHMYIYVYICVHMYSSMMYAYIHTYICMYVYILLYS
jgi:hypothetical protein